MTEFSFGLSDALLIYSFLVVFGSRPMERMTVTGCRSHGTICVTIFPLFGLEKTIFFMLVLTGLVFLSGFALRGQGSLGIE